MKSIKKIVKNPANALRFMCDGLENQSARKAFYVDMGSYGGYDNVQCFGCAATCAIQEIAGRNLLKSYIGETASRAAQLNMDGDELNVFELCIDDARAGRLRDLFDFFDLPRSYYKGLQEIEYPPLYSNTWRRDLPKVRECINKLLLRFPEWA